MPARLDVSTTNLLLCTPLSACAPAVLLGCAACHCSAGEVSCANYESRKYGIHAGMFIAEAKRRCPSLLVVPYLFDKYQVQPLTTQSAAY